MKVYQNRKFLRQLWKIALLAVFIFAFKAQSFAANYSLKGSFTYQTHQLNEKGKLIDGKILNRTFSVLVDDNKWTIKSVLVGNPEFDYFLYSYDGTNLYYFCKHSQNAQVISGSPATNASSNWLETITVETSPVPKTITTAAGEYVWLAFASGAYFKELPTGSDVIDFLALRSRGIGYTARRKIICDFNLSPSSPFLITDAKYFEGESISMKLDGSIATNFLDKPFDGRRLLADFKSAEFTNVSGVLIPISFKYVRYKPIAHAQTVNDIMPILTVQGRVESISKDIAKWRDEIPKQKTVVFDLRPSEPNIMYVITNGSIPPTNSKVVWEAQKLASKITSQKILQAEHNNKNQDLKRNVVVLLLLSAFILPLVFITYKFWRRKNNAETKKSKL